MSDPRIIKKYTNRRMYDTAESRSITLQDVRRLVVEQREFVVVEQRTDKDLTRTILLQVIAEQETQGLPLLSCDSLLQIIRCYGDPDQSLLSAYLEQSLRLLAEFRLRNLEQTLPLPSHELQQALQTVAQQGDRNWRAAQNEILELLRRRSSAHNSR